MPKTEVPTYVCHKCKSPATGRYAINKEEASLAFCDEHQELIATAFYCLLNNRIDDFNKLMGTNLNLK